MITTFIVLYLIPLAYSILQLTKKPANPSYNVDVFSKSFPFASPVSYLLLLTYMVSESFVSFLLILSEFVISTLILYPWASILFPRNFIRARPIVPTDYEDPNEFLLKCTKLVPGRKLIFLGLLATITMPDSLIQEAWYRLQGWYKAAVDRAPQPARATLKRVTAERVALYSRVPPRETTSRSQ